MGALSENRDVHVVLAYDIFMCLIHFGSLDYLYNRSNRGNFVFQMATWQHGHSNPDLRDLDPFNFWVNPVAAW